MPNEIIRAANENEWTPTPILDAAGNNFWRPGANSAFGDRQSRISPPPPPPPPPTSEVSAELDTKLKGAFLWLTLLTVAFGVAFLFIISRIDEKFSRLDDKVSSVQATAAGQGATMEAIRNIVVKIEDRTSTQAPAINVDGNEKTSPH